LQNLKCPSPLRQPCNDKHYLPQGRQSNNSKRH
jgi:hypothetical protein